MSTPLSARFLSLVIHDLRNPLNAIDLSLQVVDQEVPPGYPELEEDLRMVRENVAQVERMLKALSDFSRLIEEPIRVTPMLFDPSRLVSDILEEAAHRAGADAPPPATLEIRPGCPAAVELDQGRAHLAIHHLLANALIAAEGAKPVRFVLDGSPSRLTIAARVDRAPHSAVTPTTLSPEIFDRLVGTPVGRLGLELTIAARVSELFGGSARLDVDPDHSTTLVLDWPTRVAARP